MNLSRTFNLTPMQFSHHRIYAISACLVRFARFLFAFVQIIWHSKHALTFVMNMQCLMQFSHHRIYMQYAHLRFVLHFSSQFFFKCVPEASCSVEQYWWLLFHFEGQRWPQASRCVNASGGSLSRASQTAEKPLFITWLITLKERVHRSLRFIPKLKPPAF